MPARDVSVRNAKVAEVGDPRFVRSSEALSRALLKLLSEQPFETITIKQICAEAGVGYTTYFRHHQTKEELLDEIAAKEIGTLISISMSALQAENVHAACMAICYYVEQRRPLWKSLLTGGAAAVLRERYVAEAHKVSSSWPKPISANDANLINRLCASAILEILKWWLEQSEPVSIERVGKLLAQWAVMPATGKQR